MVAHLRTSSGLVVVPAAVVVAGAAQEKAVPAAADTVRPLIEEAKRVLVPGGIASLDVGPTLRARELTRLMTEAGFRSLGRYRSCVFDPNGQVVFRLG